MKGAVGSIKYEIGYRPPYSAAEFTRVSRDGVGTRAETPNQLYSST